MLPIVKRANQAEIEAACLKRSDTIWPAVVPLRLTMNERVKSNPENQPFIEFLLRVGEGREPMVQVGEHRDYVRIPNEHVFTPAPPAANAQPETIERQFVRAIYPGIEERELLPDFASNIDYSQ